MVNKIIIWNRIIKLLYCKSFIMVFINTFRYFPLPDPISPYFRFAFIKELIRQLPIVKNPLKSLKLIFNI